MMHRSESRTIITPLLSSLAVAIKKQAKPNNKLSRNVQQNTKNSSFGKQALSMTRYNTRFSWAFVGCKLHSCRKKTLTNETYHKCGARLRHKLNKLYSSHGLGI